MNLRPTVDFMALLAEAGVPTTEQAMEAELKKEVEAAGSLITNDSDVSPFWRLVRGVVITPALWLIRTLLAGHVLPNTFAATATDAYLDLKAWDVDLTRKAAQKTRGLVNFTKVNPAEAVTIPADVWITTERINGTIYRLRPLQEMVSPAGEAVAKVVCEAEFAGSAWNLAPGYYNLLSKPVTGILSARNADRDWVTTQGADAESNDALGLRIQNQFSAVGRYHIDAIYRSMLASVAGIRADHIFFEHDAPRGPGTANAFILLEVGTTPASLIEKLNDYVNNQGNHGHGAFFAFKAVGRRQVGAALGIGDGGLQFTLPELASAVEAQVPLIVLLWNNQGYEEIKKYMVNRAIEPVGVDTIKPSERRL